MGKYLGSTQCIHHRDSNPSMAIYLEVGGWKEDYSYYCFGCHASGILDEDTATDLLDSRKKIPIQDSNPELDIPQSVVKEFLVSRNISSQWYLDYGIMQVGQYGIYLPCLDYKRQPRGFQIRDIRPDANPKVYSRPGRDGKYPTHSWIYGYSSVHEHPTVCIVESILDGLSIWSRIGVPGLAILGTNPGPEALESLSCLTKDYHKLRIVFDPDEAGDESSIKLLDKLRILGYNVSRIRLEDKVYQVSKHILREALRI